MLVAMMSLHGMFDGPGDDAERIGSFRADDEWLDYSVELLDAADPSVSAGAHSRAWPPTGRRRPSGRPGDERADEGRLLPLPTLDGLGGHPDRTGPLAGSGPAETGGRRGGHRRHKCADLAATLTEHQPIDEYRIALNPSAPAPARRCSHPAHPDQPRAAGVHPFGSGIVEIRLHPPPRPDPKEHAHLGSYSAGPARDCVVP